MQRFTFSIIFVLLASVGCHQKATKRTLASSVEQQAVEKYYADRVELDFLKFQEKELKWKMDMRPSAQPESQEKISRPVLENELRTIQNRLSIVQQSVSQSFKRSQSVRATNTPTGIDVYFDKQWRRHHDEIIVHNLKEFPMNQGSPVRHVVISNSTAHTNILQLTNYSASWDLENLTFKKRDQKSTASIPTLKASLVCQHDAVLYSSMRSYKVSAGQEQIFTWYDTHLTGSRSVIQFQVSDPDCVLKFGKTADNMNSGLRITSEDKELAKLLSPEKKGEVCLLPNADQLPKPAQFYLSADLTQTTCPIKVDQYKTLEESLEGLNAKIRLLTGRNLTPEYIQAGNPFAPLDYTKAPKLDAVLISYLVFRADFGGQVIMQALRHHARQGALIRIAVSDVISLGKDRQMLFDFQSQFPNVKLLFYKYNSEGKGLKDWLNSFHRTNHIKFFMTYSKSQANANAVILGGRNIHDGFIFSTPSTSYISNEVVQYGTKKDEAWARWEDFETLYQSQELVNKLMSQFFAVFHADYEKYYVRQFSVPIPLNTPIDPQYLNLNDNEIYLRSMVSIPFKDDMLLEKTFVGLLDSAEKRILLSTPYFNLTEKVLKAIERAADRGVNIELITRLDLEGDTADLILSDVNKKAINKVYDRIKVYEYTTKGKILHSKLVIIDDSVVMMGSVNLNLRSFHHDIENIAFIYGKGYNRQISDLFETYKKESKLLDEKQKTTWWKSIIIKVIGTAL